MLLEATFCRQQATCCRATCCPGVNAALWTKFGERAFSHAGPSAGNALPEDISAAADSAVFRKQLKTHYFSLASADFRFTVLLFLPFHLWNAPAFIM